MEKFNAHPSRFAGAQRVLLHVIFFSAFLSLFISVPYAAASVSNGFADHETSMPTPAVAGGEDPALLSQVRRVISTLPPETCRKAEPAVGDVLALMESSAPPADPLSAARRVVERYFGRLPQQKADVLAFHVLSVALVRLDAKIAYCSKYVELRSQSRDLHPAVSYSSILSGIEGKYGVHAITVCGVRAMLDELKAKFDGMNELAEQTSLRLQMTMDRRSRFITTLSNLLNMISSTQDALIQNLK